MNDLKSRAEKCVTHHYACDCREYFYRKSIKDLESRIVELTKKCEEHEANVKNAAMDSVELELRSKVSEYCCKIDDQQETIAKLREALEFYGDEDHWCGNKFNKKDTEYGSFGGKRARTALRECFGEEDADSTS